MHSWQPAADTLTRDLSGVFRGRLLSLVVYGGQVDGNATAPLQSLALVSSLTAGDLEACAHLSAEWTRGGIGTPLVLPDSEFRASLDVFPLEYGGIIANHQVVVGEDVLAGLRVSETDLRRGIELQAKSHLIHLREGYIESGGNPKAVGQLVAASAPALSSLLANLRRLDPAAAERAGITGDLFKEIAGAANTTMADPSPLLARYLGAVERLWQEVDRWRA